MKLHWHAGRTKEFPAHYFIASQCCSAAVIGSVKDHHGDGHNFELKKTPENLNFRGLSVSLAGILRVSAHFEFA